MYNLSELSELFYTQMEYTVQMSNVLDGESWFAEA